MKLPTKVSLAVASALALFSAASVSLAQQETSREPKVLAIGPHAEIRFAAPWTVSAVKYKNAQELVVMRRGPAVKKEGAEQPSEYAVARVLITTEPRSSYADALNRLRAIAASRDEPAQFVEIAGWPAVEVKFTEPLPRRGGAKGEANAGKVPPEILVQRVVTAIAADDKMVRFEASVLSDAPQGLLQGAQDLARSAHFAKQGNPAELQETLRTLQEEENKRQSLLKQRRGAVPELRPKVEATAAAVPKTGAPVAIQSGVGELEIAASADANNVIIAANSGLSFSTDRGAHFNRGATGVFGLDDPTLARAQSGNFYLGVIAFPNGTASQLNVTGCTNAVSRSTTGGASFGLQGYSAQCPLTGAVCFPDQPHIAADAVNTAAGGNDQLYAVWRNFTPSDPVANCGDIGRGFVTASIACSQDNGVTWTARAAIPGDGDLPRVAVGRDGTVYVVSMSGNSVLLNRFTSCANGLIAETPSPVTAATLSGQVACPVPGLDRCNDGNTLSSPTVAPDPDNASHVFVTFAESDGSGGERIVAVESDDRGAHHFPIRQTISADMSARRFMPWSCSTRGAAWVGWYDRSASAAPGAASNDLTDYFVGSTGGLIQNLSNNPDPQCASGWPCGTRSSNDSESCSVQPQLAGFCGGGVPRCDFSGPDATICPAGGTCQGGSGCPKYGDYNGIACAGNHVIAAWASATAPAGLPPTPGIEIYASVLEAPFGGKPTCGNIMCPIYNFLFE